MADSKRQLFSACRSGDLEGVKELLTVQKVGLKVVDQDGVTPLMYAVAGGHHIVVDLVASHAGPALVNRKDKLGRTALHLAALRKDENCIMALLRNGANFNVVDNDNSTPLDLLSCERSLLSHICNASQGIIELPDKMNKPSFFKTTLSGSPFILSWEKVKGAKVYKVEEHLDASPSTSFRSRNWKVFSEVSDHSYVSIPRFSASSRAYRVACVGEYGTGESSDFILLVPASFDAAPNGDSIVGHVRPTGRQSAVVRSQPTQVDASKPRRRDPSPLMEYPPLDTPEISAVPIEVSEPSEPSLHVAPNMFWGSPSKVTSKPVLSVPESLSCAGENRSPRGSSLGSERAVFTPESNIMGANSSVSASRARSEPVSDSDEGTNSDFEIPKDSSAALSAEQQLNGPEISDGAAAAHPLDERKGRINSSNVINKSAASILYANSPQCSSKANGATVAPSLIPPNPYANIQLPEGVDRSISDLKERLVSSSEPPTRSHTVPPSEKKLAPPSESALFEILQSLDPLIFMLQEARPGPESTAGTQSNEGVTALLHKSIARSLDDIRKRLGTAAVAVQSQRQRDRRRFAQIREQLQLQVESKRISLREKHSDLTVLSMDMLSKLENELEDDLRTVRRAKDEKIRAEGDQESRNCTVCLTRPRDRLLLPCKHLCVCNVCISRIMAPPPVNGVVQVPKCPVCRVTVKEVIDVYS